MSKTTKKSKTTRAKAAKKGTKAPAMVVRRVARKKKYSSRKRTEKEMLATLRGAEKKAATTPRLLWGRPLPATPFWKSLDLQVVNAAMDITDEVVKEHTKFLIEIIDEKQKARANEETSVLVPSTKKTGPRMVRKNSGKKVGMQPIVVGDIERRVRGELGAAADDTLRRFKKHTVPGTILAFLVDPQRAADLFHALGFDAVQGDRDLKDYAYDLESAFLDADLRPELEEALLGCVRFPLSVYLAERLRDGLLKHYKLKARTLERATYTRYVGGGFYPVNRD